MLAKCRLGLDGTVHAEGLPERRRLWPGVRELCQTPQLYSERMFEEMGS
jgi:hypothetical protein